MATEAFWYDCADDFSPFGNDTGSDTLALLEEWLTEHGPEADVAVFVRQLLHEQWKLDREYLDFTVGEAVSEYLANPGLRLSWRLRDAQDLAIIAAALGQFKITGQVGEEIREMALLAFQRQLAIAQAAGANQANPFREAAPQYIARMEAMRDVLHKWT